MNKKALGVGGILSSFLLIIMLVFILIISTIGGGNSIENACEVNINPSGLEVDTKKPNSSQDQFIKEIAYLTKNNEYNIMPSLTIAQAVCESGWGTSYFATERNNLFGLGAYDENPNNAFKFKNRQECVDYHDKLLSSSPYNLEGIYSWGIDLQKRLKPYASDPAYFKKLKNIVDKYDLTKYDDIKNSGKKISHNVKKEKQKKEDDCIDSSPVSPKKVSMNINTKSKPYTTAGGNPYAPNFVGQCTWFAWGRFYEWYGVDPGFSGNGQQCVDQLISVHPNSFKKVSDFSELQEKSIFSCKYGGMANAKGIGHVGCIEKIDMQKKQLVVSEGNVNGKEFAVNTFTFSEFKKRYPNGLVFAVRK